MKTYSHSGDDGDVIFGLRSLKQLGPCHLRLTPSHGLVRSCYTPSKAERIASLVRLQPYILSCSYATQEERDEAGWVNIDGFRRTYKGQNIIDWQSDYLGLGQLDHAPWVTVPEKKEVAEIVIHRSPRYHNDNFPWWDVPNGLRGRVVMVGAKHEHDEFVSRYGAVPYYETKDFLELAMVIAGSKCMIGNQSAPMAVAQAMGHTVIQETCTWNDNCSLRDRTNVQYVRHWGDGVHWPE